MTELQNNYAAPSKLDSRIADPLVHTTTHAASDAGGLPGHRLRSSSFEPISQLVKLAGRGSEHFRRTTRNGNMELFTTDVEPEFRTGKWVKFPPDARGTPNRSPLRFSPTRARDHTRSFPVPAGEPRHEESGNRTNAVAGHRSHESSWPPMGLDAPAVYQTQIPNGAAESQATLVGQGQSGDNIPTLSRELGTVRASAE